MISEIIKGISIPFIGTALGAACVFFMVGEINGKLKCALNGFAAGVMTAASVWSLLIPAMEQSEHLGKLSFIPAVVGLFAGVLFLQITDIILAQLHKRDVSVANADSPKHSSMLMFAVSLHNLPEGMAVGVIYVGLMLGNEGITAAGALAVSIGIAIQNFPEGAIISMPLRTSGKSKTRSFVYGVLSGIIEPIGAVITILFAWLVVPLLPYLLSFAAGSMLYVVVAELVPEMYEDDRSHMGTWMFSIGFAVMMLLDVALG